VMGRRLAESSMTVVSIIFLMNLDRLLDQLFCAVSDGAAGWRAASKMSVGWDHPKLRRGAVWPPVNLFRKPNYQHSNNLERFLTFCSCHGRIFMLSILSSMHRKYFYNE